MSEDIPLTATDDVSLATILRLLAGDDVDHVDSKATLDAEFAPEYGRVAVTTAGDTDDVWVGDGAAWRDPSMFTGLLTGRSWPRLAPVTADATLEDQGVIQPVDTSGNAVTVTLASAAAEDGAEVVVKDEGGNAGTNAITVATEGGETVDGAVDATIGSNYGVLRLYSDGSNWFTR